MRNILLATALVFGLGACGGKGDEAIKKMEGFKNDVCACADMACAEKVMKEMVKYGEEWEKSNKDVEPSKDQKEKADKIGDEMQECVKKLTEKK